MRHVIFYAPPREARFYAEVLNWLEEAAGGGGGAAGAGMGAGAGAGAATGAGSAVSAALLYTRFDGPALERVAGSQRAARMLAPAAAGGGPRASSSVFI